MPLQTTDPPPTPIDPRQQWLVQLWTLDLVAKLWSVHHAANDHPKLLTHARFTTLCSQELSSQESPAAQAPASPEISDGDSCPQWNMLVEGSSQGCFEPENLWSSWLAHTLMSYAILIMQYIYIYQYIQCNIYQYIQCNMCWTRKPLQKPCFEQQNPEKKICQLQVEPPSQPAEQTQDPPPPPPDACSH